MKRLVAQLMTVVTFVAGTAFSASAEMKIMLKNGRSINVPVDAKDISQITFSGGAASNLGGDDITWDFESSDLRGWDATGDAFNYQPTYGDNPTERHRGQPSQHQGEYWIGGFEKRPNAHDQPGAIQGDGPQGTLTSQPFTINSRRISFLIGGGCDMNTERVEVLVDGRVVHQATGKCTETMERVRFDVGRHLGRSGQIRLVDSSSGGWGHINFDDLRFE